MSSKKLVELLSQIQDERLRSALRSVNVYLTDGSVETIAGRIIDLERQAAATAKSPDDTDVVAEDLRARLCRWFEEACVWHDRWTALRTELGRCRDTDEPGTESQEAWRVVLRMMTRAEKG
jgi:hypothetical protein